MALVGFDTVCICQDDLVEKGAQVQMIGEIFSGANGVIVWVGSHDISPKSPPLLEPQTDIDHSTAIDSDEHILAMIGHEYWCRSWVVQEIFRAKSLDVWNCCGHMSWETFIWRQGSLPLTRVRH